jgi:glycosyltransferase involved in cell wall biosynthesis
MSATDNPTTAASISAAVRLRGAVLHAALRLRPRRVSAMLRVKNEAEFLAAAVRSIIDSVDEVVLVDNGSTDATPKVIAALRAEFPDRVVVYGYPYEIARVGRETAELAQSSAGRSRHLSGVYYTWCLRRCRQPYVLKWDADMIATPALQRALAAWRRSHRPVLIMQGANVHPDRRHLAAARCSDHRALLAQQRGPRVPAWITTMAYDYPEPRLIPRWRARYGHAAVFTQSPVSPFLDRRFAAAWRERVPGAAFLHLKFCKRQPYTNYSDDLARVIAGNLTVGEPLDEESQELLAQWGIGAAAACA